MRFAFKSKEDEVTAGMAQKGHVDILSSIEAAKTLTKLVKINIFRTLEVNKSIKQSTEHVF